MQEEQQKLGDGAVSGMKIPNGKQLNHQFQKNKSYR